MDKELKPPFVPPKAKMINDKDILKQVQLGKPVMKEISVDR